MDKYLLEYSEEQKCFHNNPLSRDRMNFTRIPFSHGFRPVALIGAALALDDGFGAYMENICARALPYATVYCLVNLWIANAADRRRLYFKEGRVEAITDADLPGIISL